MSINIPVPHTNVNKENTYTDNNKVSWGKANDIDIAKYKYSVEEKLKMVGFNCDLFRCKDVTCVQHGDMLQNVYEDVLGTCIYSADECNSQVNTGQNKEQRVPGWNDQVVDYHQEALDASYCVCVEDVVNAVKHLKSGKSRGEEGLNSDHLINAPYRLILILCQIFNIMIVHGMCPQSMLIGTMISIPKEKRQVVCKLDNFRTYCFKQHF